MSPGAAARLRVQLLGKPCWRTDRAEGHLQAKFAALVALVAIGGRQSRDTVARQLWPGDLPRARDNLRQHVTRLRKATGHAVFEQGDSIELLAPVECDVDNGPSNWPLQELLADRQFLAGMEYPDLPALNGWIEQQRERWLSQIAHTLVQRSAGLERGDDRVQALTLVDRATALAPWLESAWRAKMRLHYLAADHAAAALAFTRLKAHLALAHALPSGETLTLWRTIERGGSAPAQPLAIPASLLRPPVVVGRERQLAAMLGAWQTRRPFLLRGEAGVGKTRVLMDFVRQDGAAVVVNGRKGDEHAPYSTLGTLLRALIDQQGLVPEAWVRRELSRLLPEEGAPPHGPPAEQITVWRAVDALLQQAAECGVRSIVLDDLHFADVASLEAWRWLSAGASAQVLQFAFATRPLADGPQQALVRDWLTDSVRPHIVDLAPLTPDELARLLETLDLSGAAARVAVDDLYAHAGGQPFLVLETLKELALQPESSLAGTLPRPPNATPLLHRRVQTVPAHALPLLQLTAVLGTDVRRATTAMDGAASESMAMAAALEAHGIVRDGRLVHDLMRSTVLDMMPSDDRRRWHGVAAAALATDPGVPRATIAHHWTMSERWPEAALAFRAAGRDARDAGRLPESQHLFDQAATCSHRAGDVAGEFEALHESFEANCDRLAPAESDRLVCRLAERASNPEQQARATLARVHVDFTRFDRGPQVLDRASNAVALAGSFEHLRGEALNLQGMALAQLSRFDDAVAACREAIDLAASHGQIRKARERRSALAYVLYAACRIGEAIDLCRTLAGDFESAGDVASAGQVECNLATLILLAGDPAAALPTAQRARQRLSDMQAGAGNPLVMLNAACLGSALTCEGRFEEALELLTQANATGQAAAAPARIKVQLALAHLWLLLGHSAQALDTLGPDDEPWPDGTQVLRCWVKARAAAMEGRDARDFLDRIGHVWRRNWDAPLSMSPWIEWSYQGGPAEVAQQMDRIGMLYERAGMPGAARAATLRRIDRLGELDERAAVEQAAALARALQPTIEDGLHACIYLPEAWHILAQAFSRAGDLPSAAACRDQARRWIEEVALPNLPRDWRDRFARGHPANRALLRPD